MSVSIIDAVIEQLKDMPQSLQFQVLEFAQTLARDQGRGIPGRQLLSFAGSIYPEDLYLIQKAIEEDCNRVDVDEW